MNKSLNFFRSLLAIIVVMFFLVECSSDKKRDADNAAILTPEEAIEDLKIEDGFEVQTVAAEPLIEDPVALTFDGDGNMWVVELRGYMHDEEGSGEDLPLGRIKLIKDIDANGEYETTSVFIDSLIMPRAVAIVKGGVLIIE